MFLFPALFRNQSDLALFKKRTKINDLEMYKNAMWYILSCAFYLYSSITKKKTTTKNILKPINADFCDPVTQPAVNLGGHDASFRVSVIICRPSECGWTLAY